MTSITSRVALTMISCAADVGDDLDMVNASESIMETSDNFAKKEKSGSFVR